MIRAVAGSVRAQLQLVWQDLEDLQSLLTGWLNGLVFVSILVHAGRSDLVPYAIAARVLMSVGQMGIFIAGELISRERGNQTLELLVATPSPISLVVLSRIGVISLVSLLSIVDSWIIARVIFDVPVRIYHPEVLAATIFVTFLAATATALVAAAFFSLAPAVRTYQNSFTFPLYVLGGVLVPVTFLPDFVEPLSRGIFLYWAANLVRSSMQAGPTADLGWQLAAIAGLGLIAGVIGTFVLHRMIEHLKKEGQLGLA